MRPPFPTIDPESVGWISEEAMIEVDRVMIDDLGIGLIQMMENAGRNLARVVLDSCSPDSVAVACGSGGNGGGDMVAARPRLWLADRILCRSIRPAGSTSPRAPRRDRS